VATHQDDCQRPTNRAPPVEGAPVPLRPQPKHPLNIRVAQTLAAHPWVMLMGPGSAPRDTVILAASRRASDYRCMQRARVVPRFALAVAIAAVALVETVMTSTAYDGSAGEADPSDATPPSPVAGDLDLSCGVWPASNAPNGSSRATFTCWVNGAPAGDTSFTLQALRIAEDGSTTEPIGPVCGQGTLVDGRGVCTGTLTDPSGGLLIGGLLIVGTLQPSGTPLGPIPVSPTLAGL
jgi:hypothetical protein